MRHYILLTQCLGTCGVSEALHVLGDFCGLPARAIDDRVIEVVCEDSENVLRCASKITCARYVVREILSRSFNNEWEKLLESALNSLLSRYPYRPSRGIVKVRFDVYDPGQTLISYRQLVDLKLLSLLNSMECRIVPVKSIPDFYLWLGILGERIILGEIIQKFRGDRYKSREPHRRVYKRPFALTTPVARLLLNFSLKDMDSKGPFLDAFCGTGAILIEAALEGLYGVGVDILYDNIRGARRNAIQHGVYHLVDLIIADTGYIPLRSNSIAAAAFDPPYGRAAPCKGRDPQVLVRDALRRIMDTLKPSARAAFLCPRDFDHGLSEARDVCHIYVHSSLTRVLWITEKTVEQGGCRL